MTRFGYDQPGTAAIDFDIGAVDARCVRIFGAELSQDDYGARYLQLAEIEVYAGQTKLNLNEAVTSSSYQGRTPYDLIDGTTAKWWAV